MYRYPHKTELILLGVLLMAAFVGRAAASEFRRFNPIPVAPAQGEAAPGGAEVRRMPVSRDVIERGVQRIVDTWNGPGFQSLISDRAYDKSRLLDSIDTYAPRDASLRLLSMEDVQTLRQYQRDAGNGGKELVSEVSVDLVTQIEYEDPVKGFQRRNGTIELVLEVVEPLVPLSAGGGS